MVVDVLKEWDKRYWWLRGVTAAFAVLGLVPQFIDVKRFAILRAFHALLFGWNEFASYIGRIIGHISYLPQIEAEFVNIFLLSIACLLPGLKVYHVFIDTVMSHRIIERLKLSTPLYFRYVAMGIFLQYVILRLLSKSGSKIIHALAAAVISIALAIVATRESKSIVEEWISLASAYYIIAGFFIIGLIGLRAFRRGVVTVALFVATLEILYLMNLPLVSEFINTKSCAVLEIAPADC